MKVREYLTKENWGKGGDGFLPPDGKICLGMAIADCCHKQTFKEIDIYTKVNSVIGKTLITVWNDAPERTWADVQKLITDLDI